MRNQWLKTITPLESTLFAKGVDTVVLAWQRWFMLFAYPGMCRICRRPTLFVVTDSNLRENVICPFCRSFNRVRQLYAVFSLFEKSRDIRIWNMESSGSLHQRLLADYGNNYFYSAYFGEGIDSGRFVDGVRHEDVRRTSFPNDYFDFVLSSDVLEHVPYPERAFHEISRILKPGGRLIFTVPFLDSSEKSDTRAVINDAGDIQFVKEPLYHGDPLRPRGILVFTIFGWEVLEMARKAGLDCSLQKLHETCQGIIGPGSVVFMAAKPGGHPHR